MIFVGWLDKNARDQRFFRVVADLNLFSLAYCFGFGLGFCLVLGLGLILAGGGTFGSYLGVTSCSIGCATYYLFSLGFSFSGRYKSGL